MPRSHISRGPSRLSAWPTGTGTRKRMRNSPKDATNIDSQRLAEPRGRRNRRRATQTLGGTAAVPDPLSAVAVPDPLSRVLAGAAWAPFGLVMALAWAMIPADARGPSAAR